MTGAARKHDVFHAIADPTRREMLKILADGQLSVTLISNHFPISRPAVSKHLKVLEETELVRAEKVGKERLYRLQPEGLKEVKDWLGFYEQFWDNKLGMLRYLVESDGEESN